MASPELQTIIDMLRQPSPLNGTDIHAMRETMAAAETLYQRPDDVRFEPTRIGDVPCEWTVADTAHEDHVLIHFHGGGYVLGGIGSHRGLCANLSRSARARVLNVDYRLAPENRFPAAVEDALAVYRAVSRDVDPARIALSGDSAGGGLVFAALVSLRDAGDAALPAAGVAISPWTDLTGSGESVQTKADADPMVSASLLELLAKHYLGGANPREPTASPLYADLAGLPSMLIQVGTAEILLDDSARIAERATAAGVEVEYEPWDEMVHVWHTFADMLPEARQAIDRIGEFLAKRWA